MINRTIEMANSINRGLQSVPDFADRRRGAMQQSSEVAGKITAGAEVPDGASREIGEFTLLSSKMEERDGIIKGIRESPASIRHGAP
ncbi:MAG: hypothetical protein JXA20_02405 [Spirochaetes bacterium]|nr:hypothetical protein [Spirochaetota bacterium]